MVLWHMMLFFAGEALCEIPQVELADWHSRLSSQLFQSGFILLHTKHTTQTPMQMLHPR
jgi:hypothetical protein